jgi:hypothetical protein
MLNPDMPIDHDASTPRKIEHTDASRKSPKQPAEKPETVAKIRSAKPFGFQIAPRLGLAAGVLPRVGPVIGLGLGATSGDASLWLDANYEPPETHWLADHPNVGARLWSASLGMVGCWTVRGRLVALGPCVGGEATRLQGVGEQVSHPQRGVVYWYSATVGAHFDLRLHARVSLQLLGTGLVPLDRPSVYFDDLGQVHRPSEISGRVQAGVVIDLL